MSKIRDLTKLKYKSNLYNKVIVIGSTNLCVNSIVYLIKQQFQILGVVALDNVVKDGTSN